MKSSKVDYSFLQGSVPEYFSTNGRVHPSSMAVAYCMIATSVNRIFTADDMKEFLFRFWIVLCSMSPENETLPEEKLLSYSYKGETRNLSLGDIIANYGLEVFDFHFNFSERNNYLQQFASRISGASMWGFINGFIHRGTEQIVDGKLQISPEIKISEITPDIISKAEAFAEGMMKGIPVTLFTDRPAAMTYKEKEIEERQEKINRLPVFEIDKIPAEVKLKCLELIWGKEQADYCMEEPDDFDTFGKPMIFLAWLYANGYIEINGCNADAVEGYDLEPVDYHFDEPIGILGAIKDYNIEKAAPLLKGLLV